jgi:hypothetical protein
MHTLRHRIVGFVALALLLVPVLQAREPHPEAPAEERARVLSRSMLDTEERIQEALNEAGSIRQSRGAQVLRYRRESDPARPGNLAHQGPATAVLPDTLRGS